MNRDGALKSLVLPDATSGKVFRLPLLITQAQEDALLKASQADQLMASLGEVLVAFQKNRSATQTNMLLKQLIARAQSHGLESIAHWARYCEVAAKWGLDFDEKSPWRDRLEKLSKRSISIDEALGDH